MYNWLEDRCLLIAVLIIVKNTYICMQVDGLKYDTGMSIWRQYGEEERLY